MKNPGMLFDVILQPGSAVTLQVPQGWAGFAYVYDGAGSISGSPAKMQHALVLGDGDHITAEAAAAAESGQAGGVSNRESNGYGQGEGSGLKFLLMAGQPIGEPIVQHGPFVMNSQEEIMQAFTEYQAGRLQDPRDNVWEGDDEL
jgi:redox-sensitive bicupin YhaK (pirin superfamily)